MECLYPRYVDSVGSLVPCGKCVPCLINRRDSWSFRMLNESKVSKDTWFLTLTYNDESVPLVDIDGVGSVPVLCKRDAQLFMKRLRYFLTGVKVRFYLCGEYGTKTLRPHYHAILFCDTYVTDMYMAVHKAWISGFCKVSRCSPAHFDYCAKYCVMPSVLPEYLRSACWKPFSLSSRRPGIGSGYINDENVLRYYRSTLNSYVTHRGGYKQNLPRYYKDAIFSKEDKQILKDRSYEYSQMKLRNEIVNFDTKAHFNRRYQIFRKKEIEEKLLSRVSKNSKL